MISVAVFGEGMRVFLKLNNILANDFAAFLVMIKSISSKK